MKKLEELTELEIKDLSYDGIELLIKLRKAEEGVKFVTQPVEPEYFKVPEKDLVIYQVKFLGNNLVFQNVEDAQKLIDLIKSSKGAFKVEYGVESTYYTKSSLYPYSGEWDEISSQSLYSEGLYSEIKDLVQNNKKLKEEYTKSLKEYQQSIDDAKWIEKEIKDKVYEVKKKYQELNDYCYYFRRDYLPLANNDEKVAMAFMNKAYALTDKQQKYILENYGEATTEV